MRFPERTIQLAISFLLPVVYFAASYFFVTASVALGESDRAIVWAEGNPSQLEALSRHVVANRQFTDGRVASAGVRLPIPEACGTKAREFSIGSLRAEETHAARALLESLASEAGASVCLTNVFVISELPGLSPQRGWSFWSATLLQTMLLPLGIVLAIFLAFSNQLQLSLGSVHAGGTPRETLKATTLGIFASLAVLGVLQVAGALLDFNAPRLPHFSITTIGIALAFGLTVVVPLMEEVVFRGWMLPLIERTTGTLPAVAITALVFAAARLPATPAEWLLHAALGAIYSAIYVRTRALWPCVLANVVFSALPFVPLGQ